MAQYTIEDIADLKENIINYQGITFVGDVIAEDGEITKYWQPTIGLYKGFEQIDAKKNTSNISRKASDLFWGKLSKFANEEVDLLFSVNNYKNWLNIKVDSDVNIVDAFELYENEPEFVAINKNRTFLFAIHVEYPSEYEEQLWLYFFKIEKDEYGNEIFIREE